MGRIATDRSREGRAEGGKREWRGKKLICQLLAHFAKAHFANSGLAHFANSGPQRSPPSLRAPESPLQPLHAYGRLLSIIATLAPELLVCNPCCCKPILNDTVTVNRAPTKIRRTFMRVLCESEQRAHPTRRSYTVVVASGVGSPYFKGRAPAGAHTLPLICMEVHVLPRRGMTLGYSSGRWLQVA